MDKLPSDVIRLFFSLLGRADGLRLASACARLRAFAPLPPRPERLLVFGRSTVREEERYVLSYEGQHAAHFLPRFPRSPRLPGAPEAGYLLDANGSRDEASGELVNAGGALVLDVAEDGSVLLQTRQGDLQLCNGGRWVSLPVPGSTAPGSVVCAGVADRFSALPFVFAAYAVPGGYRAGFLTNMYSHCKTYPIAGFPLGCQVLRMAGCLGGQGKPGGEPGGEQAGALAALVTTEGLYAATPAALELRHAAPYARGRVEVRAGATKLAVVEAEGGRARVYDRATLAPLYTVNFSLLLRSPVRLRLPRTEGDLLCLNAVAATGNRYFRYQL